MVRRLSAPRRSERLEARPGRALEGGCTAAEPHARPFATEQLAPEPRSRGAGAQPARLGRYQIGGKIADGGMAAIFVGRAADGARAGEADPVAIKMIRDEFARNPEFLTMFMDEAKIVSRLRHPNIVRYHEFGDDGGHLYIVMELLFGQSLWSVWDACRVRGTRLRYELCAWMGARVADGLHYAHELLDDDGRSLEIVHRDVNATNIFVTHDGDIKVIDFGLAKAANRASKTAAGIIKGKVAYMSPEQAVGAPVDRRTDVFALGTTLWELTCNRRLFKHLDEVETLRRVHAADVPDPTRIVEGFPPALGRVLERALARDKGRRYQTAAEFGRDLDAFARSGAQPVGPGDVAALMRELFAADQARQPSWAERDTPFRAAPRATWYEPTGSFSKDGERVASPPPAHASGRATPRPADDGGRGAPDRQAAGVVKMAIAFLVAVALAVTAVVAVR